MRRSSVRIRPRAPKPQVTCSFKSKACHAGRVGRPSGTVTFLFTDIEGSTQLWEEAPDAMRGALERHDAIVSAAISAHGGSVFSAGGDGFAAVFHACQALEAALDAQLGLVHEPWPAAAPIRGRIGLHTGEASERDGDYFGPALNRTARLMAIAHGEPGGLFGRHPFDRLGSSSGRVGPSRPGGAPFTRRGRAGAACSSSCILGS